MNPSQPENWFRSSTFTPNEPPRGGTPNWLFTESIIVMRFLTFQSLLVFGCAGFAQAVDYIPVKVSPPPPRREFRAAWVASVGNIDWPSRRDLSVAEQKAELLAILDRAAQLKLNAIIFQVRPACDALYSSKLEPWSEYLTGTMGKLPQPFYDPLAFAVEEAHRRGLELHAWFNPYRARHPNAKSPISAGHISHTQPALVRRYGNYLWLDPGEKEVQEHSLKVVLDVVRRYDVDGAHFDDYFYPYKESEGGRQIDFPDDSSWKKYGAGGRLSREDWRRENVNTFIRRVYNSVKSVKPTVKFGISPFGIWRPGYPQQIQGFDAYAELYADARKWLVNGWLDYLAPQLYWAIEPKEQSFPVLLNWWNEQNIRKRHVWPGMNTTRVRSDSRSAEFGGQARRRASEVRWRPEEIVNQIRLAGNQPVSAGHIHWNMTSLMRNAELGAMLAQGPYAEPALVPACPWLKAKPLTKPQLRVAASGQSSLKLAWESAPAEDVFLWVLQYRRSGKWTTELLPGRRRSHLLDGLLPDAVALSPVDRAGNLGPASSLASRK